MTSGNGSISKGFILKARKIEDSAIAHSSPCVRELWDLVLRKANYTDKKCGRTTIKRGQWLTTYEEIQELLHWRIGYRKLAYTRHQINGAMKTLRSHTMVTTTKATRGLFITIVNYDFYQTPGNYEGHNERHNEGPDNAPGKRIQRKKEKKERKEEAAFAAPTPTEVDEYAHSIGYHRPNLGRDFCQKYEATGWRLTDGKPMSNWKLSVQTWRKMDERNPGRAHGGARPEDGVAPPVRDKDGLTPRERVLQEAAT